MVRALLLEKSDDAETPRARIAELEEARVRQRGPAGSVLVRVAYSALNYKDALAVTGRGPVVRGAYPFVPGIDLAGVVLESGDAEYAPGDRVLQTGWQLGESVWGGYAGRQWLRADQLVSVPDELSLRDAMIAGTAGFTAALAVDALEEHGALREEGTVVVTGASGGVGSFAVALLARTGTRVTASTGTEAAHEYLRALDADRIVGREGVVGAPEKPLESALWSGAVDTVGAPTMGRLLAQVERRGAVAACGNAGGARFETTVYPFILRGVDLLGIDSNTCPNDRRRAAWRRLAAAIDSKLCTRILDRTVELEEIPEAARTLLDGEIRGRVLVRVDPDVQ